eukprot:scaffold214640_cov20-Prasinocladus_malaysianus.AAC.1
MSLLLARRSLTVGSRNSSRIRLLQVSAVWALSCQGVSYDGSGRIDEMRTYLILDLKVHAKLTP